MNAAASTTNPALLDREVTSFSIDSREVQAGDVFFALSQPDYKNNGFNGDFEDATKYVTGAFEKGAVACVVRPDRYEEHNADLEQYYDRLILLTMRYLRCKIWRTEFIWNGTNQSSR